MTYAGNLSTLAPVMDNPNFRFVKADICDREAVDKLFEEEHPDIVVNFAAESHVDRSIEDPGIFLQTNIIGTSVLMDACRKYGIQRYHQVSTDASSFGVSEIPASQVKKTKEYLSRFSMISVREKQGAEIVEKLTGKKAEVCCDPTVLTDRKRWDELSGACPFVSEKYIFCYFIGNNPSQREFAKKLAQKTDCKILAVKHIDEYIKSDDDLCC